MKITEKDLTRFAAALRAEERSPATIEKYCREAARFAGWLKGRAADRELALAYKAELCGQRAPAGVNGAIAALNRFFDLLGLGECRLKAVKVQRRIFREEEKELTEKEYRRLLAAERPAAAGDGEHLCHRHPGQRAAFFYCGGRKAGPGGGVQ